MSGTSDRTEQDTTASRSGDSGFGGNVEEVVESGPHGRYELTNAVECVDPDEGSVCFIYPSDASDAELQSRWLAVPASLLLELEDVR
jgi:hypothetical protein